MSLQGYLPSNWSDIPSQVQPDTVYIPLHLMYITSPSDVRPSNRENMPVRAAKYISRQSRDSGIPLYSSNNINITGPDSLRNSQYYPSNYPTHPDESPDT